jgi:hypothetical protein
MALTVEVAADLTHNERVREFPGSVGAEGSGVGWELFAGR